MRKTRALLKIIGAAGVTLAVFASGLLPVHAAMFSIEGEKTCASGKQMHLDGVTRGDGKATISWTPGDTNLWAIRTYDTYRLPLIWKKRIVNTGETKLAGFLVSASELAASNGLGVGTSCV
ncbi:MAG: hypothetical protein FWG47_01185 [Propionibacteriaceae bacterium]|nr:hypothetical protein [Propionibacteriaceae bacterium]